MKNPGLQHADLFDYPNATTASGFVEARPDLFRTDFVEWLKANFPLYAEFHRRADSLWQRGRRHYSARTIFEAIRFDTDLREQAGDFKVNNNFIPDCARLYQLYQNGRDGFFERRVGQSAVRAA